MTTTKFIFIIIFLGLGIWLIMYFVNKDKKIDISKKNRILFIGDSFTASNYSYADQIKQDHPNIQITKIAKVGAKTDWMLEQATQELASNKYDSVFVLGGVNDIYSTGSIAKAEENLQAIYDLAKKSGASVIGITIAPSDYYSLYDSQKGKLTNELNSWIMNNRTLDYTIDFNSLLKKNGVQDASLFIDDKLHVNSEGQRLLAYRIENKVFI